VKHIKTVINTTVSILNRVVPHTEPERPISKLVDRVFTLMTEALALHPQCYYKDGNYPRLLEVTRRTLIYLAEHDGHYAGQLSSLMLLTHDAVEELRQRFHPGREGDVALLKYLAQHPIIGVKDGETE